MLPLEKPIGSNVQAFERPICKEKKAETFFGRELRLVHEHIGMQCKMLCSDLFGRRNSLLGTREQPTVVVEVYFQVLKVQEVSF